MVTDFLLPGILLTQSETVFREENPWRRGGNEEGSWRDSRREETDKDDRRSDRDDRRGDRDDRRDRDKRDDRDRPPPRDTDEGEEGSDPSASSQFALRKTSVTQKY